MPDGTEKGSLSQSAHFSLIKHAHEVAHVAFQARCYDSAGDSFDTMLRRLEVDKATSSASTLDVDLRHNSELYLTGYLRSNRSACMLREAHPAQLGYALVSAKTLPRWSKVWYRLGRALLELGEASAAAQAFAQGGRLLGSSGVWWQGSRVAGRRFDDEFQDCRKFSKEPKSLILDTPGQPHPVGDDSSSLSPADKTNFEGPGYECPSTPPPTQLLDRTLKTTIVETIDELHELIVRKQQSTTALASLGRCPTSKLALRFADEVVWAYQPERPGDFANETLTLSLRSVTSYMEQASAVEAPRIAAARRAIADDVRDAVQAMVHAAGTRSRAFVVRGAWLFLGTSELPLFVVAESRHEEVFPTCVLHWIPDTVSRIVDYSLLQAWRNWSRAAFCVARRVPKDAHELEQLFQLSCVDMVDNKASKHRTNKAPSCRRSASVVMIEPSILEEGLTGNGIVRLVQHTRRRLCTPHAWVLPFQAELMIAPCSVRLPTAAYPEAPKAFAAALENLCWSPWYETVDISSTYHGVTLLAPPKQCFTFDFVSADIEFGLPVRMNRDMEFTAELAGDLNAIVFWYNISLLPSRHRNGILPVGGLSSGPLVWQAQPPSNTKRSSDSKVERCTSTYANRSLQWVDRVSLKRGQCIVVNASHTYTRTIFRVKVPVSITCEQHVTAVPRWHLKALADEMRSNGFRVGIKEAVASTVDAAIDCEECTVLVVGTGSGLQSFLAAKAGASLVVGIDDDVELLRVAHRLAKSAKADNLCFFQGNLRDFQIGVQFSRRFDILLLEKFDAGLLGGDVLALVHLAWTHFLKPSAIIIPRRGRVYACCVDLDGVTDDVDNRWRPYKCGTRYTERSLALERVTTLTQPIQVFEFDFNDRDLMLSRNNALVGVWQRKVAVAQEGRVSAVSFWFELDFLSSSDCCVSTHLSTAGGTSCCSAACQAVDGPYVRPGDEIELHADHFGSNITFAVCSPSCQSIRIARPMFDEYWLHLQSIFFGNSRGLATNACNGATRHEFALAATSLGVDPARFVWWSGGHVLGSKGNDVVWALF
mmetsp:Transcript_32200/g.102631  ORF Transcript_32200/g.102631 Transcript_32200/m.102631 type:complete len:1047 (-) Transcript_32200:475-3615(-)|eukprot:CAMPEP_0118915296 /NCGR_PEP_ID=MMETSP1166-20130328/15472_1 /TAXON_ID=1104430 /ORGANISM="Chrysoreinhardia sp, Strain CCMP3193" /LENGTH=1046 /DNA_ID=CAMNT_0006854961 /DNA_START=188 /DNA_END=3328 /DNA_ORIENTATION=-